jgi:hypothetical protein
LGHFRHIGDPAVQVALVVQVHDDRVIRRTALDLEDPADRGGVCGVCAQAVNRLGRKHHEVSRAQRLDGFLDFGL